MHQYPLTFHPFIRNSCLLQINLVMSQNPPTSDMSFRQWSIDIYYLKVECPWMTCKQLLNICEWPVDNRWMFTNDRRMFANNRRTFVNDHRVFANNHQMFADKCRRFPTTVDSRWWIRTIVGCLRRKSDFRGDIQRKFERRSMVATVTWELVENWHKVCHFDDG